MVNAVGTNSEGFFLIVVTQHDNHSEAMEKYYKDSLEVRLNKGKAITDSIFILRDLTRERNQMILVVSQFHIYLIYP